MRMHNDIGCGRDGIDHQSSRAAWGELRVSDVELAKVSEMINSSASKSLRGRGVPRGGPKWSKMAPLKTPRNRGVQKSSKSDKFDHFWSILIIFEWFSWSEGKNLHIWGSKWLKMIKNDHFWSLLCLPSGYPLRYGPSGWSMSMDMSPTYVETSFHSDYLSCREYPSGWPDTPFGVDFQLQDSMSVLDLYNNSLCIKIKLQSKQKKKV